MLIFSICSLCRFLEQCSTLAMKCSCDAFRETLPNPPQRPHISPIHYDCIQITDAKKIITKTHLHSHTYAQTRTLWCVPTLTHTQTHTYIFPMYIDKRMHKIFAKSLWNFLKRNLLKIIAYSSTWTIKGEICYEST